ncbi:MAG TPA: hypothetical protein VFX28_00685, partial [Methylomirabilota bacterium]|nr:hypothetical protein [Methylomirabilota bacterium]
PGVELPETIPGPLGIQAPLGGVSGSKTALHAGRTFGLLGGQLVFGTGDLAVFDAKNWFYHPFDGLALASAGVDLDGDGVLGAGEPSGRLFEARGSAFSFTEPPVVTVVHDMLTFHAVFETFLVDVRSEGLPAFVLADLFGLPLGEDRLARYAGTLDLKFRARPLPVEGFTPDGPIPGLPFEATEILGGRMIFTAPSTPPVVKAPEASAALLLGLGAAGLGAARLLRGRRRARRGARPRPPAP